MKPLKHTSSSANSNNSLKISKSENWRKNFYQDLKINPDQLTVYRLSGRIKVENVNGRHDRAYLRVQFFGKDSLELNSANNLSQNIRSTQDWNTYEVDCIAPLNAVRIRIGGGLWGGGAAWFDDFTVERYTGLTLLPSCCQMKLKNISIQWLRS